MEINYHPYLGFGDARKNKSSNPFSNLPNDLDAEGYVDLIKENWNIWSAASYYYYKEFNERGIIVVSYDDKLYNELFSIKEKGFSKPRYNAPVKLNGTLIASFWWNEEMIKAFVKSFKFNNKWNKLVSDYNPNKQTIIALNWGATKTDIGNFNVKTLQMVGSTPKENYQEIKNRTEEFIFVSTSNY